MASQQFSGSKEPNLLWIDNRIISEERNRKNKLGVSSGVTSGSSIVYKCNYFTKQQTPKLVSTNTPNPLTVYPRGLIFI